MLYTITLCIMTRGQNLQLGIFFNLLVVQSEFGRLFEIKNNNIDIKKLATVNLK